MYPRSIKWGFVCLEKTVSEKPLFADRNQLFVYETTSFSNYYRTNGADQKWALSEGIIIENLCAHPIPEYRSDMILKQVISHLQFPVSKIQKHGNPMCSNWWRLTVRSKERSSKIALHLHTFWDTALWKKAVSPLLLHGSTLLKLPSTLP